MFSRIYIAAAMIPMCARSASRQPKTTWGASLWDNGTVHEVLRTFDETGHQLSERTRYTEGVDAGIDMWCWTRTFDPCGNRLSEERWSSRCDEPSYSRTTLSYDCR